MPTEQFVTKMLGSCGKAKGHEVDSLPLIFYATVFSRGHAILHLAVSIRPSIRRSVGPSVRNVFELRAVFTLLLLPNRPRLDCRVSGLALVACTRLYTLLFRSVGLSVLLSVRTP